MPLRSDLEAAHARIAALERELAAERGTGAPAAHDLLDLRVPPGHEVTETADRLRIAWTARGQPWPAPTRAILAACFPVATLLVMRDHLLVLCVVGIVVGLAVLLSMGDRVVVEIRGHRLHIPRSPVTGREDRALPLGDIDRLFCVARHHERPPSYELWSQLMTGERFCLVRAMESAEAARFLERALGRRLVLAGRPVSEQLRLIGG